MEKLIWRALKLAFISSRGCSIVVPNYLVLKESVYFSVVFTFVRGKCNCENVGIGNKSEKD